MRNLILSAALVTASLFGMTAQAADNVPLEAGKTYVELANPVPVSVPGKIEVVELFWYGCPHCYAFEPVINPWVEKLPEDVNSNASQRCSAAHGMLMVNSSSRWTPWV